ncbi:MAG: hypothetical protein GWN58_37580, partial [Anaerolineae bacterium]|nr:hypothetical protein [Anaerolineae bacterium]
GPAQPSLAGRLREIGGLVGTLFLRALGRSERVYEAMLGRGYDGTVRQLRRFHMNADDWSGLAALVGVLGVILSWPILPG